MTLLDLRTQQGLYACHWRMWDELVKDPELEKMKTRTYLDAVSIMIENKLYISGKFNPLLATGCFLCQSTAYDCFGCPLVKSNMRCGKDDSWFSEWDNGVINHNDSVELATKIRDCVLPYLTDETKKELGI